MSQLEAFCADVEKFLERSGMSPTRLGTLAVRDPSFVHQLRAGRAPNMSTADKVLSFIRAQDKQRGSAPADEASAA